MIKRIKRNISGLLLCVAVLATACGNSSIEPASNQTVVETMVTEQETTTFVANEKSAEMITETTAEIVVETNTENTTTLENIVVNNAEHENIPEEPVSTTLKDTLVVYFSATGTTKRVAEQIAELTDAELYEIVPKEPYSSADLNWNDSNSRTTKEQNDENVRPEIASEDINVSEYKTIYIGYPIWWGDAPRIMSTFVEKYNFESIKVIPFCTSGGSGIGRSGSNLASLAGSDDWSNGERLSNSNSVQSFVNNNK